MSEEKALERLVREARKELRPEGRGGKDDWSRVDDALFARLDREDREGRSPRVATRLRTEKRARGWWVVASFAAAAAFAVFVRPSDHGPLFESASTSPAPAPLVVSSLVSHEGSGAVRIGGELIKDGHTLSVGDHVETEGTRAFFVSTASTVGSAPSIAWAIDESTVLDVRRVPSAVISDGPLVLGLERGAVEAQVGKVARGEAFAIDVGAMRVAVHGTHLRVAREGARVTVDLNEGIVSIGEPPKVGTTYGTLVTAPAHATFDLDDATHAVHVDKSASAVRAPTDLTASPSGSLSVRAPGHALEHAAQPNPAPSPIAAPHVEHAGETAGAVIAPTPAAPQPPVAADPHAEATVRQAVVRCTAPLLRGADVHVTVSSSLSLRVGDDGFATFARFDPPLAPEAQSCAAAAIFHTRFPNAGAVSIPIQIDE